MAVTRSRAQDRTEVRLAIRRPSWRVRELLLTVLAALVVGAGLYHVHRIKAQALADIDHGLASMTVEGCVIECWVRP